MTKLLTWHRPKGAGRNYLYSLSDGATKCESKDEGAFHVMAQLRSRGFKVVGAEDFTKAGGKLP